jgi:16S rRNA (guanine527-N7)-methyltransferase
VTCVDTVAKKAAFIKQAALALKLPNLAGLHARVETITTPFDVICSRAFASLADFTNWSTDALAPQGAWMAMKGKHPADEIAALPASAEVFHVEQLQVPGLNAERCIVWMRAKAAASRPENRAGLACAARFPLDPLFGHKKKPSRAANRP